MCTSLLLTCELYPCRCSMLMTLTRALDSFCRVSETEKCCREECEHDGDTRIQARGQAGQGTRILLQH